MAVFWLLGFVILAVAACGGSNVVSGPISSPSPSPSPSPTPSRPFVPAAAVLYGSFGQGTGRAGDCYPVEEAARFALLVSGPYHLTQRTSRWCGTPSHPLSAIRALNRDSLILLYRMGPKELKWRGGPGPVEGDAYFERLRQTNGRETQDRWFAVGVRTGDYLVDMSYPQYVAMEPGNPNWRRYWIEQGWQDLWGSNAIMDARGASGLFVDGAETSPYSNFPFCPMSSWTEDRCTVERDYPRTYWSGGAPDRDLYKQHLFAFVQEVVPWHRSRNLLVMFNAWTLQPDYVAVLNGVGGGAMEESGFVRYGEFPPTQGRWLQRLQNLQSARNFAVLSTNVLCTNTCHYGGGMAGNGLARMDATVNGHRGWDVLWFAMTSFLLGYEPTLRNGYFHFTVWGYRDAYWFDEYDPRYLHLGLPRTAARQLGSGVWEREFERGWVWVNPTDFQRTVQVPSGRVRVLNHDNFKNPGSVEPSNSFVLPPWRGVVGVRE